MNSHYTLCTSHMHSPTRIVFRCTESLVLAADTWFCSWSQATVSSSDLDLAWSLASVRDVTLSCKLTSLCFILDTWVKAIALGPLLTEILLAICGDVPTSLTTEYQRANCLFRSEKQGFILLTNSIVNWKQTLAWDSSMVRLTSWSPWRWPGSGQRVL